MPKYLIQIEVELPEDFNESEFDEAISDTIYDMGGEVIDSKPYEKLD